MSSIYDYGQVDRFGLLIGAGNLQLVSISGLSDLPDVRTSDLVLSARDGLVAGRDLLGGRTITLTVDIVAFTADEFAQAVALFKSCFGVTGDEDLLSFRFPGIAGGQEGFVFARTRRRSGPTIDENYAGWAATAVVELFCTDPRIYYNVGTATISLATTSLGGLTFPMAYPLDFGPSAGGITYQYNAGTTTCPVVIRINGPVANPVVRNETTNQELAFNLTLGDGEWIDVDTKYRTVLQAGTINRYAALTSAQWWGLAPGVNTIRFSADSATTATAVLTYGSAEI